MKLEITNELKDLCRRIIQERRTENEWAAIESDDMFQTNNYVGGFDATEMAFCFSFYNAVGTEYWFQLTLAEVEQIAVEQVSSVEARLAG